MNLRGLKYFVALAEPLHFYRSAAACFVSQPTLSTPIRKLEAELGVALVERAPRRVMLTPAGRAVAAPARRAVADFKQMRDAARRSPDPAAGPVRLGHLPPPGPSPLPPLVPALPAHVPPPT